MIVCSVAVALLVVFLRNTNGSGILNGATDLGYQNFTCHFVDNRWPKSVNDLQPNNIGIVAAMGDSLTAGYAAGSTSLSNLTINYRGLSFSIGGDEDLERHITIPNILKKFNPSLFGQSYQTGLSDQWFQARLNVAVAGAKAIDMLSQAKHLVQLMRQHPEIDMDSDWKLIHIFIGANDAIAYCNSDPMKSFLSSPISYKTYLESAVQYLFENVPRVIVSIVSMLNMQLLRDIDRSNARCAMIHREIVKCDDVNKTTDMAQLCREYQKAAFDIQNSGLYERNDFTVVVQPMLQGVMEPKLDGDGKVDLSFFAPDCFHFSRFGHAVLAKFLWNNLLQPVGKKVSNYNLSDTAIPLLCPDVKCPYIRTVINSYKPC